MFHPHVARATRSPPSTTFTISSTTSTPSTSTISTASTTSKSPSPTATNTSKSNTQPSSVAVVVVIIVVISGFLVAALYIYLRSYRRTHSNPKYVPTNFLKSRWRSWDPRPSYGLMGRQHDGQSSHDLHTNDTSYNPSIITADTSTRRPPEAAAPVNGVDRNTSVRSVITLPPYNPYLDPSELLIAREGERAGIDTVVEFPETAEEEELRREEDMESLYQIRQARRREIEEREERRRERQLARDAGDWARIEQLRLESQLRARVRADSAASTTSSLTPAVTAGSNSLIAEHNARTGSRERRVSSVSYADLGLARHDGSRLRADSVESSDQRPLLDSAASMGGREDNSRRSSLGQLPAHRRNPSAESGLSHELDTQNTPRTSMAGDRNGSIPSQHTIRLGTGAGDDIPPVDPPRYEHIGYADEEAPPYGSPVAGAPPQVPRMGSLPAIEVTGTTPANSVPATPVDGLGEGGFGREEQHRGRR